MTDKKTAKKPLARIRCSDLAFILPFRARHDVRWYLEGFYAEPLPDGGAALVATDGHRLGVIRSVESFVSEPVIVRTEGPLHNTIMGRNPLDELILDDRISPSRIQRGDAVTYIQPGAPAMEAKYVGWRNVIPRTEQLADGLPGCVDALYLQSVIDAFADMRRMPEGIYFQHQRGDIKGVIVVRSTANDDLVVALMPQRHDRKPYPAWLGDIGKPLEPAANI